MKVTVNLDQNCEMLSVEFNGNIQWFGNYWDFSHREMLDILNKLPINLEVNYDWEYEDD